MTGMERVKAQPGESVAFRGRALDAGTFGLSATTNA